MPCRICGKEVKEKENYIKCFCWNDIDNNYTSQDHTAHMHCYHKLIYKTKWKKEH